MLFRCGFKLWNNDRVITFNVNVNNQRKLTKYQLTLNSKSICNCFDNQWVIFYFTGQKICYKLNSYEWLPISKIPSYVYNSFYCSYFQLIFRFHSSWLIKVVSIIPEISVPYFNVGRHYHSNKMALQTMRNVSFAILWRRLLSTFLRAFCANAEFY